MLNQFRGSVNAGVNGEFRPCNVSQRSNARLELPAYMWLNFVPENVKIMNAARQKNFKEGSKVTKSVLASDYRRFIPGGYAVAAFSLRAVQGLISRAQYVADRGPMIRK